MIPILIVAGCWLCILAAMLLDIGRIPKGIAIALLALSFVTGLAIDIYYLSKCREAIYRANMRLMTVLYLICSFIAIVMCMGAPIGNLALGILAGLYGGRRCFHAGQGKDVFDRLAHSASFFTACVIGVVSFPVGMLALYAGEEYIIESIAESVGLPYSRPIGFAFIIVLWSILVLIQFWLTRISAILAYRGWSKNVQFADT